jgi:hypothetical protein
MFITAFTYAHHLSHSCAWVIQYNAYPNHILKVMVHPQPSEQPSTRWTTLDQSTLWHPVYLTAYYSSAYSWVGTAVAQLLRYCATNRKFAGSIPDGVIGIFHCHNASDRTMATEQKWVLGAFPGGKGGRCIRLTTLPPSCAVVMQSGNLNSRPIKGLLYPLLTSVSSGWFLYVNASDRNVGILSLM